MNPLKKRLSLMMAAVALCTLSLMGYAALAASTQKSAPAPKAAPSRPAASSRPASSGGGGGAASHGSTGSASHGPSANSAGSHGPTANGAGSHGPTANGAGSRGPTANGAGSRGPTANAAGGRGPTNNATHTTAGAGNRATPTNRTATGHVAPTGSHTVQTHNGAVTRRADGRVSDVHDAKRGMDIHHGLDGGRRVSVTRHDGSRVVSERGRRGFVERRYNYHGHDFARRSYYWHGHEYNRYYRGYYYHGVFVNVYAPGYYYAPAFYGWAYNPWYAPVPYAWGWGGAPWFGFYGAYFAPYPVYAGPAFWLTDYLIAEQLQAAYAAQAAAAAQAQNPATAQVLLASNGDPVLLPADSSAPVLSPQIKQQVTDEVKAEIALENSESQQNAQGQDADPGSSGIERLLGDGKQHVFVAGDSLDVTDSSGAECALSDGDVLQFSGPAPDASQTDLSLAVLASKGGKECQTSATVTVAVADLQEMQNHLRETIDQGMQELQSKQGTGGLPAAPPSAKAAPTQTAFAQNAPPAEQNGAADVNQQMADADSADQEATQSAPASASGGDAAPAAAPAAQAAPVDIALGQTISQVTAALGQPVTVIDLGTKKIYKYKDMKITFKDGKVADVE